MKPPELQIFDLSRPSDEEMIKICGTEDPLSSSSSPARVGDLMSPDLKIISYQDGGGPAWRTVCNEEGAAVSFLVALLTQLTSVANVLLITTK